jgi:hypothetical protein
VEIKKYWTLPQTPKAPKLRLARPQQTPGRKEKNYRRQGGEEKTEKKEIKSQGLRWDTRDEGNRAIRETANNTFPKSPVV